MNNYLRSDNDQFGKLLELTKRHAEEFLEQIDSVPTSRKGTHIGVSRLSEEGCGARQTLIEFNRKFGNTIVSSTGPRYWGFVTGGATPAAVMGDWLASVFDQNTQTSTGHGDISASIEFDTINLLLDLLNLPKSFLGGFVTGATMSNFTCLGVARQWFGRQVGQDFAKNGVSEKLNIVSATPHSSSIKSLSMLGIGSRNITRIDTMGGNREAIDIDKLKRYAHELNGKPFILISSAGTVNTVDFDDFVAIDELRKEYNFWWHIDAAFGGLAACSPLYQHLINGWENADSITVDCHKWLNVPYESAFYLVKEAHKFLQVETFQNSNAPYLGDPLENFNYLNFLPENSRRLRALPTWFTLTAYGKEGHRQVVENNVKLARMLGSFIESSKEFVLLSPVRLNTVCFTLARNHERSGEFLKAVNDTGKVFMTPTMYNSKMGIRAALVNWRTAEEDIVLVQELLNEVVKSFDS